MITLSADEARTLYQVCFTDSQLEVQIRQVAVASRTSATRFLKRKVSEAQVQALRNNGFTVLESLDMIEVSWNPPAETRLSTEERKEYLRISDQHSDFGTQYEMRSHEFPKMADAYHELAEAHHKTARLFLEVAQKP